MESTVYIADSKNAPYGEKPVDEIIALSISNTQKLIDKGAKVVVVACNTATTQAISVLRSTFDIPFVGIEPAIKPAALRSKTKCIGVLATHGTIESDHFNRAKENFNDDVQVVTQVGEGLVRLIEQGNIHSDELTQLLTKHLNVLIKFPIDHLVLGCTHYPLLIPVLKNILSPQISIVDPGQAVALQVKRIIMENKLDTKANQAVHLLFTSGDIQPLKSICQNELNVKDLLINYSSLYQSE